MDQIRPTHEHVNRNRPEWIGQHIKTASARLAYAIGELERCQGELADKVAYYLKLHELGIDGLPHEWLRKADRELDERGTSWKMCPRNVDMHRATCVERIGFFTAKIACCKT